MNGAIDLLDEALDLAKKEKTALEGGQYDEAMDLAEQRGKLTGMAWNLFEPALTGLYHKKIAELAEIQRQLAEIATKARDMIRDKLSSSRQEKRRMRGYHRAVEQALQ